MREGCRILSPPNKKSNFRPTCLVRLEEFESPTFGSVDQRSIQLSYKRIIDFFQNKTIIRGCEAFVNKNMNKIDWQKFCCLHMLKWGVWSMKKLKFQACLDSVSAGVPFRFCSNVVELEVESVVVPRKSIPVHIEKKDCVDKKRNCYEGSIAAIILLLDCLG